MDIDTIMTAVKSNTEKYNCVHGISGFKCQVCNYKEGAKCSHGASRMALCSLCGGNAAVARNLFRHAKDRARRRQITFSLTLDEVYKLVIEANGVCPALGIPLIMGNGLHENTPTLDRHIGVLGYVKGNCLVISALANRIKNSANSHQIELVAKFVKRLDVEAETRGRT